MAITKIHPIKSTLNLAIDYITKSEKTDEKVLVSSFNCHPSTAHIQFMKTREDNDTKGTVLARHLIQSFLPGEVDPILNKVRKLFFIQRILLHKGVLFFIIPFQFRELL